LRADSEVLEQQVDEWAVQTLNWQASQRVEIRCGLFGIAPVAIQRRLLRRVMEALLLSPDIIDFRHVESLRQFIISEDERRRYDLPGQILVERHAKTVLLWSTHRLSAIPSVLALPVPGQVDIAALNIRLIADIIEKPSNIDAMSPHWAVLD